MAFSSQALTANLLAHPFAVTLQRRLAVALQNRLAVALLYVAAALQKRCTGFAVSIWYL